MGPLFCAATSSTPANGYRAPPMPACRSSAHAVAGNRGITDSCPSTSGAWTGHSARASARGKRAPTGHCVDAIRLVRGENWACLRDATVWRWVLAAARGARPPRV